MTRAVLFDAPGPPGPAGPRGFAGAKGDPGPDWVLNAKNYGAAGDGQTDDTKAIRALVAAAKAASAIGAQYSGISIYFPHGVYLTSEQINFDTTAINTSEYFQNTTIYGDGGGVVGNGNRGTTTLIYTGTGTNPFIAARATVGFYMHDLAVLYSSSAFTGTLIDCGGYATFAIESINPTFINVSMGCDGASYSTAAAMLSLDGCLNSVVEGCHIAGAQRGIFIRAHASLGGNNSTWIRSTAFGPSLALGGVFNPDTNTTVINCSFEDMPNAIGVYSNDSAQTISGLTFWGNWLGDSDAFYDSAWIDPGNWLMCGANIASNFFGQISGTAGQAQHDSIKLGSCQGVTITGNSLGTVDFTLVVGGSYPQGVTITGNQLNGGNTAGAPFWRNRTANSVNTMIFGNYPGGYNASGGDDQIGFGGHIVTWPSLHTQPSVVGATHVTPTLDGSTTSGSNDTSGRITLVVSGGPSAAGVQVTITYARAFSTGNTQPRVILSPENAAAAALAADVFSNFSSGDLTMFTINSIAGLANNTYTWAYLVIG